MSKQNKYNLNSLLNDLKKSDNDSNEQSSDFWKPTIDKGEERVEYMIRFLPNPDSKTNAPWVERASHMFKFPSGKFIYEPCVKKTKNEKCYICEEVARLYQSGDPNKEKIGSKRFSRKRFFHNILVIKDPRENGKNEGKVFIFECGAQVYDKCIEILKNEEIEEENRIYFHPTMGTNFKLIMTWKSNYQNYEKSDFVRNISAIKIDGNELDEDGAEEFIENNCFGLTKRMLDNKNFKSYDDLKNLYLNQGNIENTSSEEEIEEDIEEDIDETIKEEKVEVRNPKKKKKVDIEVKKEERKEKIIETDKEDDEDDEDAELEAIFAN